MYQQPSPPYGPPQHQQPPPPKKGSVPTPLIIVGALIGTCFVGTCLAGAFGQKPNATVNASATPTAMTLPIATAPMMGSAAVPSAAIALPTLTAAPAVTAAAVVATGESAEGAVLRGAPVSIQGLEATVLNARVTRRVSRNFLSHSAPEGATLLVVSYRVRNTTTEPIQVTSLADEVLAGGATYRPSMECSMAVNTLGVTDVLNPNIPRTFEACFEVPPTVHGYVVKFNRVFTDRFAQTGL